MADKKLWAPWRMDYIKHGVSASDECIFCSKPELGNDEDAYIVSRGELAYVILNAYPYNNGHLMVAPYEHSDSIADLGEQTLVEIMRLASRATEVLKQSISPEGFNIGINQGKVAGAGVEHHLHLHVVPRWGADTNFMPVLANTRVLPQHLSESYREISEGFRGFKDT